jgi:hypothetical protein
MGFQRRVRCWRIARSQGQGTSSRSVLGDFNDSMLKHARRERERHIHRLAIGCGCWTGPITSHGAPTCAAVVSLARFTARLRDAIAASTESIGCAVNHDIDFAQFSILQSI